MLRQTGTTGHGPHDQHRRGDALVLLRDAGDGLQRLCPISRITSPAMSCARAVGPRRARVGSVGRALGRHFARPRLSLQHLHRHHRRRRRGPPLRGAAGAAALVGLAGAVRGTGGGAGGGRHRDQRCARLHRPGGRHAVPVRDQSGGAQELALRDAPQPGPLLFAVSRAVASALAPQCRCRGRGAHHQRARVHFTADVPDMAASGWAGRDTRC